MITDLVHCLLAVSRRLIDPGIKKAGGKAVRESVIFIRKCDIPEIIGDHALVDRHIRQRQACPKGDRHAAQGNDPVHFTLELPAPAPHGNDPKDKGHHSDDDHHKLKGVKIVPGQLQSIRKDL